MISNKLKLVSAIAIGLTATQFANAAITVSGSVGGAATGSNKLNFDTVPLGVVAGTQVYNSGGQTVDLSTVNNGQVVSGSVSGQYAAPFVSGGNGTGFGNANGADTTRYLTTGSTGAQAGANVTLQFSQNQKYLGILWGSVDDYNTLSFYNGNTLVGSVTGSQVVVSPNGDQGVNGTLYVNIGFTGGDSFNKVVATSTQYAFEFDNVAFNTVVPEPSTYVAGILLGLPVVVQGVRRLKNRQ